MLTIILALALQAPTPLNDQHIAKLREQIAGREKLPAAEVFKNVQVLQNMTAERLLAVMQMGFTRALGVGCEHCHEPGQWESDGKPAKAIAREMFLMTGRINKELLGSIAAFAEKKPPVVINCNTCHRGQIKP